MTTREKFQQWRAQWKSPHVWIFIAALLTMGSVWLCWLYPLYHK